MTDPRDGICAIMMLKNENRFIMHDDGKKPEYTMLEQNLRRLKSLVEEVYIVDNGSKDGSKEIYEKYRKDPIFYTQYNDENLPFDDVRDRVVLLEVAKRRGMKWMLVVDGDEIYEERADKWIHEFTQSNDHERHWGIKFHYINFWRSRLKYRTDAWNGSWFERLYSLKDLRIFGTALHNYGFQFIVDNKVISLNSLNAPVKCLHYGWADWQHRVNKTERYKIRDMELNHITYEEASRKYYQDTNEMGLTVRLADPEWGEEFRTGRIGY